MIKAVDISDDLVEIIENEVGMGSNAWDMVNPKIIIAAILNRAFDNIGIGPETLIK